MKEKEEKIVGIDLGSGKTVCMVGSVSEGGNVRILGIGEKVSTGMRDGHIVHIERTVQAIKECVEDASETSGEEITSSFVGITGEHIKGESSRGMVAITHQDLEIREDDVRRVLEQARAGVSTPMGKEIILVHPNSYIIDDQGGIKDPLGMVAVKLEVEAYILSAQSTVLRNIERTLERANIDPLGLIFQPISASLGCLDEEEFTQGIAVIDIGKGTTDIAVWFDGDLLHTSVRSIGGDHITNDIAIGLKIPKSYAEELKRDYGCASLKYVKEGEELTIESVMERESYTIERKLLSAIIEPRIEEILKFAHEEILKTGQAEKLAAGVTIVGGTAQLSHLREFAEDIFNLPVTIGTPRRVSGLTETLMTPAYVSSIGLLRIGAKLKTDSLTDKFKGPRGIKGWLRSFLNVFRENF